MTNNQTPKKDLAITSAKDENAIYFHNNPFIKYLQLFIQNILCIPMKIRK